MQCICSPTRLDLLHHFSLEPGRGAEWACSLALALRTAASLRTLKLRFCAAARSTVPLLQRPMRPTPPLRKPTRLLRAALAREGRLCCLGAGERRLCCLPSVTDSTALSHPILTALSHPGALCVEGGVALATALRTTKARTQ